MYATLVFLLVLGMGSVSWASGQCVSSREAAQLAYNFMESDIDFNSVSRDERYDIVNSLIFIPQHKIYGFRGYFSTLHLDSQAGEQIDIQVNCLGMVTVLDSRKFR